MSVRLGGNFEIDPLGFSLAPSEAFSPLPAHYKLWLDTGRSALSVALRQIVDQGGKRKALLPAYICSSVIKPFLQMEFEIRFYSLTPSKEELAIEDGETLLFLHYFGQKNLPAVAWVAELRKQFKIFVIEDCVQSSLNNNVGDSGDYVITSFRKFLHQPDGALLASQIPITAGPIDKPSEEYISKSIIGKVLRQNPDFHELFLKLLYESEGLLDSSPPREMSALSKYLFERTDIKAVALRRRANWDYLNKQIQSSIFSRRFVPIMTDLAPEDIPLGFPIRLLDSNRDALKSFLAKREIFTTIHWELDHLDSDDFRYSEELNLSRSILTLPIDQRINTSHLDYLINALNEFYIDKDERGE